MFSYSLIPYKRDIIDLSNVNNSFQFKDTNNYVLCVIIKYLAFTCSYRLKHMTLKSCVIN